MVSICFIVSYDTKVDDVVTFLSSKNVNVNVIVGNAATQVSFEAQ